MKKRARALMLALGAAGALAAIAPAGALANSASVYRVTISNLSESQPLTPPVVSLHRGRHEIFRVGDRASLGLQEVAENGNTQALIDGLRSNRRGSRVLQAGDSPLLHNGPADGREVTFTVRAPRGARHLSFASMLICTNDGFTGSDSLRLPRRVGRSVTTTVQAYDAHTERNTEDFNDLVPPCAPLTGVQTDKQGTGQTNPDLAEGGVIAAHGGIQGVADLTPATHGWDGAVARITARAIR